MPGICFHLTASQSTATWIEEIRLESEPCLNGVMRLRLCPPVWPVDWSQPTASAAPVRDRFLAKPFHWAAFAFSVPQQISGIPIGACACYSMNRATLRQLVKQKRKQHLRLRK